MKLNKHSGIRLRTESLKNTLPANKRKNRAKLRQV